MVTACPRLFSTAILLAALPLAGWAQDAKDAKSVLSTVARAMGAENLRTLQYSGSGSTYDEKGQHSVLKSYSRTMDLNTTTATTRYMHASGSAEQASNQNLNSSSPWNIQYDFWITPFGFLKGASAHEPVVETKSLFGESYRVISFTLPGNHRVSGYINGKNLVERVHLTIDNGIAVEAIYHDYTDFSGLKVPTMMIQRRAGAVSQVLVVKDVRPNG